MVLWVGPLLISRRARIRFLGVSGVTRDLRGFLGAHRAWQSAWPNRNFHEPTKIHIVTRTSVRISAHPQPSTFFVKSHF